MESDEVPEPSPEFWALIDEARAATQPAGSSASPDALRVVLGALPDDELIQFAIEFEQALIALNTWELWGAGYVMAGGMSDDSFHYFREWVVGHGQLAFDAACLAPDELGVFAQGDAFPDNEGLEYAATDLLEERGVDDGWTEEVDGHSDQDPSGDGSWDEDTVAGLYPKLAERFGLS